MTTFTEHLGANQKQPLFDRIRIEVVENGFWIFVREAGKAPQSYAYSGSKYAASTWDEVLMILTRLMDGGGPENSESAQKTAAYFKNKCEELRTWMDRAKPLIDQQARLRHSNHSTLGFDACTDPLCEKTRALLK